MYNINSPVETDNYPSLQNIAVYDVLEQNVGTNLRVCPDTGAEASPARTIDVSHLAKGMYYLKINAKL